MHIRAPSQLVLTLGAEYSSVDLGEVRRVIEEDLADLETGIYEPICCHVLL